MKKILVILILLSLDLYPDSLAKLKMACDIGNEKACSKLQLFQKNKTEDWGRMSDHERNQWQENKISATDAQKWIELKVNCYGVTSYLEAGVDTPEKLKEWIDAGINNIFIWKNVGVETAKEAQGWIAAGVRTREVKEYKDSGIMTPDEIQLVEENTKKKVPGVSSKTVIHHNKVKIKQTINNQNKHGDWDRVLSQYGRESWKKTGLSVKSVLKWIDAGVVDTEALVIYKNFGLDTPDKVHKWYKIDKLQSIYTYIGDGIKTAKEARKWAGEGFRSEEAKGWKKAGVSTPVEASEWSKLGIRYSDIDKLKRINIRTIPEAKLWVQVGVKAGSIEYWKENGVNSPEEAHKWIQANVHLGDLKEWKDAGMSPEEAKQWKDAGITRLSDIKNWKKVSLGVKDASRWKKIGLNPRGADAWIKGGISTADEAKKWGNIGVDRVSSVKEWKSSGILVPKKAKVWIDADFRNGYLWAKEGFDIEQAKKWKDAGLNYGYSYYKDGIKTIKEAIFAKECKNFMSYELFNEKKSGIFAGKIIQSLPDAYLVATSSEIYYIPKFDGKLRSIGNYVTWRVTSRGLTYTYNSTGNGVMQVAKVFYVFPDKDECNKYVPLKQ